MSHLGPVTALLLGVRDERLRRCHWCGAWAYHRDPCTACATPAPEGTR